MGSRSNDLFIGQNSTVKSEPTAQNISPKIMKNYQVANFKQALDSAKKVLIVLPQLGFDSMAYATAMAYALNKTGKSASVFCPQKTDANYGKLAGINQVVDQLSASDLTVTVDYPLDQIEKVSYNDNGGKLNLVVEVKPGSPRVENQKISIQNQDDLADLYILLGDESTLGDHASLIQKGTWAVITPTNTDNKSWAKYVLFDQDAPFCEIGSFLLPMLGLEIDTEVAKNLLNGLRLATQSFTVNVSPESFEAGAICLRATQTALPVDSGVSPNQMPLQAAPAVAVEAKPAASTTLNPTPNKPNPTPFS